MSEERSYPPTPRRVRRARKEGKVVRSQLLTQLPALVTMLFLFELGFGWTMVRSKILLDCFELFGGDEPARILTNSLSGLLSFLFSCLILNAGLCTLIDILQIGFLFAPGLVAFNWDRLSVNEGLKRSVSGIKKAGLLLIRALIVFSMFVFLLEDFFRSIPIRSIGQPGFELSRLHHALFRAGCFVVLFVAMAGLVEFLRSRRRYLRDLSMSYDEIRRELREDEGDPIMRSHKGDARGSPHAGSRTEGPAIESSHS